MTALICGSLVYDNIMLFPDRFKNHILPEKIHMLNVCFMAPKMRREFGGCAGNIAYNLKLLGEDVLPMGTVGEDFSPYANWMDTHAISRDAVTIVEKTFTAQAFITTDLDDNQITAFHPGAMEMSHVNKLSDVKDVSIGVVSPDGRDGMLQHAVQFAEAGVPFIFDPGQGLPMFSGDELRQFIEQSTWTAVNDYEWELLRKTTGWSLEETCQRLQALIITRGSAGSSIYAGARHYEIDAAAAEKLRDPTGCGDAYRAGLLRGLMNEMDWETTGRVASLMGAISVSKNGTQNHTLKNGEFEDRFREQFGYAPR